MSRLFAVELEEGELRGRSCLERLIWSCMAAYKEFGSRSLRALVTPAAWEAIYGEVIHRNRQVTVEPTSDGVSASLKLFIGGHAVQVKSSLESQQTADGTGWRIIVGDGGDDW